MRLTLPFLSPWPVMRTRQVGKGRAVRSEELRGLFDRTYRLPRRELLAVSVPPLTLQVTFSKVVFSGPPRESDGDDDDDRDEGDHDAVFDGGCAFLAAAVLSGEAEGPRLRISESM